MNIRERLVEEIKPFYTEHTDSYDTVVTDLFEESIFLSETIRIFLEKANVSEYKFKTLNVTPDCVVLSISWIDENGELDALLIDISGVH